MNQTVVKPGGARGPIDVGELGVLNLEPKVRRMRTALLPGEERASLPQAPELVEGPVDPLTRFLGPGLTVANPVWSGFPIERMRSLQKRLVGHSLKLKEDDRFDLLRSISMVEHAVQLRMRWHQMEMDLLDQDSEPGPDLKPVKDSGGEK